MWLKKLSKRFYWNCRTRVSNPDLFYISKSESKLLASLEMICKMNVLSSILTDHMFRELLKEKNSFRRFSQIICNAWESVITMMMMIPILQFIYKRRTINVTEDKRIYSESTILIVLFLFVVVFVLPMIILEPSENLINKSCR